jgi:hypothetical protein
MKKIILLTLFLFALVPFAVAQTPDDTIDVWLKGWADTVVIDLKQTHPEYQDSQQVQRIQIDFTWEDTLTVTGYQEYDFYEVLEYVFIFTGDNSATLVVIVDEEVGECVYEWGVGDTVRFLGEVQTAGEGWFRMDTAEVTWCDIDVTGDIDRRPIVTLPTYSKLWFEPNVDKTVWNVYGSHESIACCYEFYVAPEEAWKVIEFDQIPPYDFFEGWNMTWRVYDNPNHTSYGYGVGFGSAQLGGMLESYNGLLGTIYTSEPMEMTIQATPDSQYPAAFWFDGEVPNWRMPTQWWVEEYDPNPMIPGFHRDNRQAQSLNAL